MASTDNHKIGKIRLYVSEGLDVSEGLAAGQNFALNKDQHHYLRNVMRCQIGDPVLIFNGRDGEWLATISQLDKKMALLAVQSQTRAQTPTKNSAQIPISDIQASDIQVLFAPVKKARLDYMVQKATEMGASSLMPVMTHYTQKARLNYDRLKANMVEAAEQCNLLHVPALHEAMDLEQALESLSQNTASRHVVFCDEGAGPSLTPDMRKSLEDLKNQAVAILIGPEGGFSPEERRILLARPDTLAISLGPRILRADTALVAALSLCQMTLGDWEAIGE